MASVGPMFLYTRFCNLPAYPHSNQQHQPRNDNSISCKAVWSNYTVKSNFGRKKLHRTNNQGSNFLGGSFKNGANVNVRAPIQFRGERQPQHLKRLFFFMNSPIPFRTNSSIVIKPVKRNKVSFSSTEINKSLPDYSVLQIQFKFRSQLQFLPQITLRYLIKLSVESSIISIDSNITYNTIRKAIDVQQGIRQNT